MPIDKTLCAAIAALALTAGCGKEDAKTTTAPLPPPVSALPAEPVPGTQAGAPTTPNAGRDVGQTVDDATVTVKVKAKLLEAADVKGLTVNVDTVNGTVTLKGEVETPAQAERAVQIARGTEGVKQVDNQLMVKARS